ncbi:SDR family oxidoreductase [Alphaproteobacteria bacterium]|nr:SDR family oxidoreductase [Alphaproteobacteria bacterium]
MNNYIDNLFNLKNKNVVIIGAGGHLCSQMAFGFANSKSNIAILDIRPKKLLELKKNIKNDINDKKINILTHKINACIKRDHIKVLKKILTKFKKIDVLINGAGINDSTPFLKIPLKSWNNVVDSQLTATFLGCQVFGEHMLKNKSGSIINISSASSWPPLSKAFAYSAAKSSIKNLTANLGREWGDKGVRVNSLQPGFFPTEWNIKNFIDKSRKKQILNHTPMRRFGDPKELIGATLWLASDASKFVTGTELTVDGGFSCMSI